MGSTFMPMTDEQLLQLIAQSAGPVLPCFAQEDGDYFVLLSDTVSGANLRLSKHSDEDAAQRALEELQARLDRLAAEGRLGDYEQRGPKTRQ